MARVIRESVPEPEVVYVSTLAVIINVTQAGALIFDGVAIPEPERRVQRQFLLQHRECLGDLVDWPGARAEAMGLNTAVLKALEAALDQHGLEALDDGVG
jgi:hypothetical protein